MTYLLLEDLRTNCVVQGPYRSHSGINLPWRVDIMRSRPLFEFMMARMVPTIGDRLLVGIMTGGALLALSKGRDL